MLNNVGAVYGSIQHVAEFVETFKAFPPRSFPPSFSASTIMEQAIEQIKDARQRAEQERK